MAKQRLVRIEFPRHSDGAVTHRIRNFGEDLYRELQLAGLADVGGLRAVDAAIDRLQVHVARPHYIGRVRTIVTKLLDQHHLIACASVSYLEATKSEK